MNAITPILISVPTEEHQGNIWHGLAWGCAIGALFYALVALAIAMSFHG